jgi:hypothetical protein
LDYTLLWAVFLACIILITRYLQLFSLAVNQKCVGFAYTFRFSQRTWIKKVHSSQLIDKQHFIHYYAD